MFDSAGARKCYQRPDHDGDSNTTRSSLNLDKSCAMQDKSGVAGLAAHFGAARSKRDFAGRYLWYLSEVIAQIDLTVVEQIIDVLVEAGECGNTIYFIGNGGSAATASHFANDIAIGTRAPEAKPFQAVSLTDNLAVITAIANDEEYSNIFLRQLEGVLQPRDVVVGLSVSGNSPNVLEALRYAKRHGAITIGCTGFDGGVMHQITDISMHIPTRRGEYGPVEDIFTILGHLIYSYLRLERRGHL
ncbi:MAG: SIS domain-containing protein [Pseudomonadota bacterium]